MADLYTDLGVGEVLDPAHAVLTKAKCQSAVTKGKVVEWNTHVSGEIGTVSHAAAGSKKVAGVALETGSAGQVIAIIKVGIVKITADGAITLGSKVAVGADSNVAASSALDAPGTYAEADMQAQLDKIENRIGVALQTFASGDTGLIFLCVR